MHTKKQKKLKKSKNFEKLDSLRLSNKMYLYFGCLEIKHISKVFQRYCVLDF